MHYIWEQIYSQFINDPDAVEAAEVITPNAANGMAVSRTCSTGCPRSRWCAVLRDPTAPFPNHGPNPLLPQTASCARRWRKSQLRRGLRTAVNADGLFHQRHGEFAPLFVTAAAHEEPGGKDHLHGAHQQHPVRGSAGTHYIKHRRAQTRPSAVSGPLLFQSFFSQADSGVVPIPADARVEGARLLRDPAPIPPGDLLHHGKLDDARCPTQPSSKELSRSASQGPPPQQHLLSDGEGLSRHGTVAPSDDRSWPQTREHSNCSATQA